MGEACGVDGTCIDTGVTSCPGTVESGLCPGPSQVRCCLPGPLPVSVCTNTCDFAVDGECDDGAEGAVTSACAFGTDCADCGVRMHVP